MDLVRTCFGKGSPYLIKNESGQSAVEYILLLLVVVSLAMSVYNSRTFQDFFGEDSSFFDAIKNQMELSYQYGQMDISSKVPDYNGKHEGFFNPDENQSRFFILRQKYGQ